MIKNRLLFFLLLSLFIPGISSAAIMHTLDIEFAFSGPDDPNSQLLGYRLYKEGEQVCETDNPAATSITCDFSSEDGTYNFTLTAFYDGDLESPPSPEFPFTIDSTTVTDPPPVPLQAVISAAPGSGTVPLIVSFNSADSKGEISTRLWDFGDGTTSTETTPSHTYSTAGTYYASLKLVSQSGESSSATTTIIAEEDSSEPEPPTAVLSSSATTGEAPLTVTFSGGSSTTPNSSITGYNWTFGDGSQATGEIVSYTYTEPGAYTARLTVTDNLQLSTSVTTPVIVTEAVEPNEKPYVVITTDTPDSDAPFTVSFNGSQSSDPDGNITRYSWNFGDGATAEGSIATHTYNAPAEYTVSLEVKDNLGETATATIAIVIEEQETTGVNFEVGRITIDHEWVRVLFENDFVDPVVIAGPPTFNGSHPSVMRLRNIDREGFDVRLQEWEYLDGWHTEETFSYIVMDKGIYTLDSGLRIEAGTFNGTSKFQNISLKQTYELSPILLTQVISENETEAVTGRVRNGDQNSFEYKLQEMELTKTDHTEETIGYIAWEPGAGLLDGLVFEVGVTSNSVTHKWFDLNFQAKFADPPIFIAKMQTQNGSDTAVLRTGQISTETVPIKVEEEKSKDTETRHIRETIGYFIIGNTSE